MIPLILLILFVYFLFISFPLIIFSRKTYTNYKELEVRVKILENEVLNNSKLIEKLNKFNQVLLEELKEEELKEENNNLKS